MEPSEESIPPSSVDVLDLADDPHTPGHESSEAICEDKETGDKTPTNSPKSRDMETSKSTSPCPTSEEHSPCNSEEHIATDNFMNTSLAPTSKSASPEPTAPQPAPPLNIPVNPPVPQKSMPKASEAKPIDKEKPKTAVKAVKVVRVVKDGTATGTTVKKNPIKSSGACARAASKVAVAVKTQNPPKNMKVTSTPPVAPTKPNKEFRKSASARTSCQAAGTSKTAQLAKGRDKSADESDSAVSACSKDAEDARTRCLVRGQTIGCISRQNSLSTSLNSNLSMAGDTSDRRSARDRVRDSNKLKVFEGHLLKLEAAQTEFLRKLEGMKCVMPEKFNREFKFIGMVQSDDCKLVVHGDFLKRLPNKLPSHTVADFKNQIKDIFEGCLKNIQEQVKNRGGPEKAEIDDIVEQEQSHRLGLIAQKMNELCSVNDTSEQDLAKYRKEIMEAKRSVEEQDRQMSELKKAHAAHLVEREATLKREFDLETAKKNAIIADLTKKVKALQKGQEMLKHTVELNTTDQTLDQEEHARLTQEINSLKIALTTATKKLQRSEMSHRTTVRELKEKNEEIAKLQKDLEQSKKLFGEVRARVKAEVSHQVHEKAKEITQLKVINDQAKKDYADLEETLHGTRKELQHMHDTKIDESQYKEEIKKLNQRLVEKDKELAKRPVSTDQYPAELKRMMAVNTSLNRRKDKLKAELVESQRHNAKLLEQLNRIHEIDEARREIDETLGEKETKNRESMKGYEDDKTIVEVGPCDDPIDGQGPSGVFKTLASKLSSKQVTLARHEQHIKWLDEQNDRKDKICCEQQKRIFALEKEVHVLKEMTGTKTLAVTGCEEATLRGELRKELARRGERRT